MAFATQTVNLRTFSDEKIYADIISFGESRPLSDNPMKHSSDWGILKRKCDLCKQHTSVDCTECYAQQFFSSSVTSRLIMYFVNDAGLRGKRPTRNRTDRADTLLGWRLVSHARILQHVGPFSASTSVTVF